MRTARWYLNRLALMSPAEVLWRLSGDVRARVAAIRGPKPVPPRLSARLALPPWQPPEQIAAASYVDAAERILSGHAELFGKWIDIGGVAADWNRDPSSGIRAPLTYGRLLSHDARIVGDVRTTLEMNRHLQLVLLAQAWALTQDTRYKTAGESLLRSWIGACPYPLGINWASSLEHGIRLINWYAAARLFALTESDMQAIDGWLDSVYRHCDFIWENQSRYSSANNHLIGEMAGLFVAATAWPCWEKSEEWRRRSKQILEREVTRQVHADGVTREQSVDYQMFVLQFLVMAGFVGESNGDRFSAQFWQGASRMFAFLDSIRDSGAHLPDFGDSDEGVALLLSPTARARRLEDLLCLYRTLSDPLSAQPDRSATVEWLLSAFPRPSNWPPAGAARRRAFPDGGYFVLGDKFGGRDESLIVFDAGPLGYLSIAAHGHADCLSFTLSVGGQQVLLDPGTYCYHGDPPWRTYFRSTAAHNTIRVDSLDQSEMLGPFMWGRKAIPTVRLCNLDGEHARVRASHSGYLRLPDPVTHERELHFDARTTCLEVFDTLHCRKEHTAEQFWHLAEGCKVQRIAANAVRVTLPRACVEFEFDPAGQLEILRGSENPISGWLSRQFGQRSPTTTMIVKRRCVGTTGMTTNIRWQVNGDHASDAEPRCRGESP
jgi:heparinase II/III-like protein